LQETLDSFSPNGKNNQQISDQGNTQSHQEVPIMKKLGILLIVLTFGLVLACGSKEEKAPAKKATPPAKAEQAKPQAPAAAAPVKPQAPVATPAPAPVPPAQAKPEQPKPEQKK
jgi:hypothetical protein